MNIPKCCGEVVSNSVYGQEFFYCRGCKKEVHEVLLCNTSGTLDASKGASLISAGGGIALPAPPAKPTRLSRFNAVVRHISQQQQYLGRTPISLFIHPDDFAELEAQLGPPALCSAVGGLPIFIINGVNIVAASDLTSRSRLDDAIAAYAAWLGIGGSP